ncbi:MAG: lysine--tRNA ligase [Methanobacteriaceae archaeon]|nr:lysine--tRNA ligase [Methanobacteriaceae archaeon]MDP2836618.1 lysine--tRNA ligase [Methanobacteriaceae archaeon]MDP3034882.1 lysine--tRNA ligase [Methanobacteriaceae archaeon]MDP3485506.1 lysine--tRNA ligase [Methanobacteriaceae archaeon]MDP3622315.1 lysine--tRNA ligase [Methanobacteriaceae archaeon]
MRHWIERIADELKEWDVEEHVVASGTSISGSIHIGNSCDVFIANAVGKALKQEGTSSKTIWIADDHDPLRKVPFPLPESYEKYLGVPYSQIPCPEGCCDSFVEHFQKPFLDTLDDFGIELETYSGAQMYKDGLYLNYIRTSLEKAPEIREIFNKYRENPLADDWLPYNPICTECGRVNTTFAYDFEGDEVSYRCECGFDGQMDIKSGEGKLTWRVEWAARWKIFGITCEPFGKDHAASGGSYDVSSVISQDIFDYKAPYPVPYEWITLKGEAMSKSHGVFFTPGQWLEIGPAESLNYFLFRNKPMKHKDFNPEMPFLDFVEQFDRVEQIYFGKEEAASEKEEGKLKKIYQMSQIQETEEMPFRPSYRFLTVAYQIAGDDLEKIYQILQRNSQLPEEMENNSFEDLSDDLKDILQKRVIHVKNWLDTYAPGFVKFQVQEKIPPVNLSPEQTAFLKDMATLLEEKDLNPEELHDEMYNILREHDLKPQKAFQAIYRVVIGKKMGPRAASFILSLDKDFVIKRLRLEE